MPIGFTRGVGPYVADPPESTPNPNRRVPVASGATVPVPNPNAPPAWTPTAVPGNRPAQRPSPMGGLFGGPAPNSGVPADSGRAAFAALLEIMRNGVKERNAVRTIARQRAGKCPPGTVDSGSYGCVPVTYAAPLPAGSSDPSRPSSGPAPSPNCGPGFVGRTRADGTRECIPFGSGQR